MLQDDDYGRKALGFVEAIQSLRNATEICAATTAAMEWFGCHNVTIFDMPSPAGGGEGGVLMNTRPQEYADRYVAENLVSRDPVVTELFQTQYPFSWRDIQARRKLQKWQRRIMDEATDFGVNDGFVVPIISPEGSIALFSPCGLNPNLSQRARSAIEIIGIYATQSLRRVKRESRRSRRKYTPLTPRERDILHWIAIGKSDEVIGEILSISSTTVTTHVENSKVKLGAINRASLIAEAFAAGELLP